MRCQEWMITMRLQAPPAEAAVEAVPVVLEAASPGS